MSKKRKTNEELVVDIMTFSRRGALSSMFVMDALLRHAEVVSKSTPADYPANHVVNPAAWIDVAKEIKAKLDEHLAVA